MRCREARMRWASVIPGRQRFPCPLHRYSRHCSSWQPNVRRRKRQTQLSDPDPIQGMMRFPEDGPSLRPPPAASQEKAAAPRLWMQQNNLKQKRHIPFPRSILQSARLQSGHKPGRPRPATQAVPACSYHPYCPRKRLSTTQNCSSKGDLKALK